MELPIAAGDGSARRCLSQHRPLGRFTPGQLLALVACAGCCLTFGGIKLPSATAGRAATPTGIEAHGGAPKRLLSGGEPHAGHEHGSHAEHGSGGHGPNSMSSDSHAEHGSDLDHPGHGPHAHTGHKSAAVNPCIFLLVTFCASALAQFISSILPHEIRLPHSVLLYFIGTFMAYLAMSYHLTPEYNEAISSFANIDPHIIFWVFLPALLFEDAAGAEWSVIQRVLPSSLLLAFPGVIVNTVLTGVFVRYCMNDWNWWMSLLLGSILSATDPVAVIGALSALSAPAKLSHLISGESLFNDGSAVALFQIFLSVAVGRSKFDLGNAIATMCRLSFGGPAFGLVMAIAASLWLRYAKKLNIQVLIIICGVYACFFVGEYKLEVSGVLAVVTFGLYMAGVGRYSFNVGVEHQYHAIINFLALISHESIFVIAGVIGYKFMSDNSIMTWRDFGDLFSLYAAIHVTRTLVIVMFWPILRKMGYGLSYKEVIICIYGGLRGALGLAMASVAASDWELGHDHPYAKKIGFHTAGIVVLTLIINGTTITPLYKWLKLDPSKGGRHHQKLLRSGLEEADHEVEKVIEGLKEDWFYHNCDFETIEQLVPKLTDMVMHDKLNFYGKMQLLSNEKEAVDAIFLELATTFSKKLEGDPDYFKKHCRDKLAKHRALSQWDDDGPLSPAASSQASGARRRNFFRLQRQRGTLELESEEMKQEVYQTVLNAIVAEYDEAYEEQRLPTAAYRVLSMSANYQQSAIEGELGVPKYGLPQPRFLDHDQSDIASLKHEPRATQMKSCFAVGWHFLEHALCQPRRWSQRQLAKLVDGHTISLDWVLLTRNLFIILQYVSTCEHILSDTRMFDDFKDILHGPLRKAKGQAITKGMEQLMNYDHGMFILLEHCVCARHVLKEMRRIISDQHKEGTLSLEDQKRIFSEVVRPSEQVLEEFLPTRQHLEPLASKSAKKSSKSWFDRLLFDMVLERAGTMH